MSYDIRFSVRVYGAENVYAVIGYPDYDQPTYNIGEMLRKCMDWDFHQSTEYPVSEVIPHVERGLHELRFNRKEYKQYEDKDGWGDIGTAIRTLQSILDYIENMHDSWNGDVPLNCLYMSW